MIAGERCKQLVVSSFRFFTSGFVSDTWEEAAEVDVEPTDLLPEMNVKSLKEIFHCDLRLVVLFLEFLKVLEKKNRQHTIITVRMWKKYDILPLLALFYYSRQH